MMLVDDNQLRLPLILSVKFDLYYFFLHTNKRKVLNGFIDQMDQMKKCLRLNTPVLHTFIFTGTIDPDRLVVESL